MPSSRLRLRRRSVSSPPEKKAVRVSSPRWLVPVMLACFVVGLLWIVVFYVTQTAYPVPDLGSWNLAIGFAFIGVGFALSTQWR